MSDNLKSLAMDSVDLQLLEALQIDAGKTNQKLAAELGISPPTCLRRVKRLDDAGLIERRIAILDSDRIAKVIGHGITALVEISLDRQDAASLDGFEARVIEDDSVQQCWRVSPGPDFILVVAVRDMPGYLALAQRLFTSDANVRNVKTFFSVKRAKFAPRVPFPASPKNT